MIQQFIDIRGIQKRLPILIDSTPQIMQLSLNLNENLINKESVAVALMFLSQLPSIFRPELVAPKANAL